MPRQDLKELLYVALAEPIGLLLATPDPARLKAQLYQSKKGDPELERIQIRTSPWPEGQLVLCKGGPLALTGQAKATAQEKD